MHEHETPMSLILKNVSSVCFIKGIPEKAQSLADYLVEHWGTIGASVHAGIREDPATGLRRTICLIAHISLLSFALSVSTVAQSESGNAAIEGVVTDPGANRVVGATVTIRSLVASALITLKRIVEVRPVNCDVRVD